MIGLDHRDFHAITFQEISTAPSLTIRMARLSLSGIKTGY
jgi:hypothetical protein